MTKEQMIHHIDSLLKKRLEAGLLEVPQDVVIGYLLALTGWECDEAEKLFAVIEKYCNILDNQEQVIRSN